MQKRKYKFNPYFGIGSLTGGSGGGGGVEPVIIYSAAHQTHKGYEIPTLTAEQVRQAYNGKQAGSVVTIVNDLDTLTMDVIGTDSISGIEITALWHETFILTYIIKTEAGTESVEVSSVELLGGKDGYYTELNKTGNYSADISYGTLNYDKANKWFVEHDTTIYGGCSSLRNGNLLLSSFDWYYNNQVSFNVLANGLKHKTWANCGQLSKLTKDFVGSKAYAEEYFVLPFMATVGGNEKDLTAQVLLMEQHGTQTAITPSGTVEYELSSNMLVRYIIDNFDTAGEAVEYIRSHVKINVSAKLIAMGKSLHFVIADNTNTYILELVNGGYSVIDCTDKTSKAVTNFGMTGVTLNADDTVYTPATQDSTHDAHTTNGIALYGAGLERYNSAISGLSNVVDIATAKSKLEALTYSKTYTDNPTVWHTEFTDEAEELAVNNAVADFASVEATAKQAYIDKDRDNPTVWVSKVQTIFDFATGKLYIRYEEENTWREASFGIDKEVLTPSEIYVCKGTETPTDVIDKYEAKGIALPNYILYKGKLRFIKEDPPGIEAGLYETGTDTLLYTWEQLQDSNYIVIDSSGVLTGGSDKESMPAGDLVISNSVTSIGDNAFMDCVSLKNVKIPNSVTSIGSGAFAWGGPTSIEIPNSVTSIGSSAFNGSALRSIEIPDSITSIEAYVFSWCSLRSITIPNSVTSIGTEAFDGTYFADITIPNSVTSIGDSAFSQCTSLTDFNFAGTTAEWNSITLGTDWKDGSPFTVVHCTDGDVNV